MASQYCGGSQLLSTPFAAWDDAKERIWEEKVQAGTHVV